jgi:hypothetical protein
LEEAAGSAATGSKRPSKQATKRAHLVLHKAACPCLQRRAYGSTASDCSKPSAKGRAHRASDQTAKEAAKARQQIAVAAARPARAAAEEACETAAGASGPGAATVKHIAEVVEAKDRHVQVPLAALRLSYQNTAIVERRLM